MDELVRCLLLGYFVEEVLFFIIDNLFVQLHNREYCLKLDVLLRLLCGASNCFYGQSNDRMRLPECVREKMLLCSVLCSEDDCTTN